MQNFLAGLLNFRDTMMTPDIYEHLRFSYLLMEDSLLNHCHIVALAGAREWMIKITKSVMSLENYGFNKLHLDALMLDKLTEKYHTASITKKAQICQNMTPLHFAAINPNKMVLEALLE